MQCTLLIPHLWWSRGAGEEAYRELHLPNLEALAARARLSRFPPIGWEGWLCQAFEVERQRDWPIAPLTLMIDGGEVGDSCYWLRADPVHLHADRDRLVLVDSAAFAVSRAESDALVQALNAHFEADRLRFSAPHAQRWYLRLDADPQIATTVLDEVAGNAVDRHLPRGAHAMQWQRIANEAQMLLHAHPVNAAREARGELPINGVWLWGGGTRGSVHGRHFSSVTGDDALAAALAANADVASAPLAADAERWLNARMPDTPPAHHLLLLDQLVRPARRGDLGAWRSALERLDAQWVAPLLGALKRGQLHELALVAPGIEACRRFELRRVDLMRFWRVRRPLAHYARPESG